MDNQNNFDVLNENRKNKKDFKTVILGIIIGILLTTTFLKIRNNKFTTEKTFVIENNDERIHIESDNIIKPDEAKSIGLNFTGGGKILYLKKDDGDYIYHLKIKKGSEKYEFEIDCFTGEILSYDLD